MAAALYGNGVRIESRCQAQERVWSRNKIAGSGQVTVIFR